MIYVMSDIHGCYDALMDILQQIRLSDDDTLYVLGDQIDRGPDSISVLNELMKRTNVVALKGNHEAMAYRCLKAELDLDIERIYDENWQRILDNWLYENGGNTTKKQFVKLECEKQQEILNYIESLPLHIKVNIGEKEYWLSHTVPDKKTFLTPSIQTEHSFLWAHPDYDERYCNLDIITGHTPVQLIDKNNTGSIIRKNGHICIDCGVAFGGRLACICLDTMQEFYAKENSIEEITE